MPAEPPIELDHPLWVSATRRRLVVCTVSAAVLLTAVVFLVRLPPLPLLPDRAPAIDLTLLEPAAPVEPELPKPAEVTPPPVAPAEPVESDTETMAEVDEQPVEIEPETTPAIDWYAPLPNVASDVLDRQRQAPSMTPEFDARRRDAQARYAPAPGNGQRPVWENVEKDTLGRTILKAGDCYRVLDDPSVINRYAMEQFTQYLVFCNNVRKGPEELPWVDELRERYSKSEEPAAQLW